MRSSQFENFIFITDSSGKLKDAMLAVLIMLSCNTNRKKNITFLNPNEFPQDMREIFKWPHEFNKPNLIIVHENFNDNLFRRLANANIKIILGPTALLRFLRDDTNIPEGLHPIHNLTMNGLCVSLGADLMKEFNVYSRFMRRMGGRLTSGINACTSHLVTNCTSSHEYRLAHQSNIKVMTPEWIEEIFKQSVIFNKEISATDKCFDKFMLPMFHGLIAMFFGNDFQNLGDITNNGGTVVTASDALSANIIFPSLTGSETQKLVAISKTPCASFQWIFDSVAAGYALKLENYLFKYSPHKSLDTPITWNPPANSTMNDLVQL